MLVVVDNKTPDYCGSMSRTLFLCVCVVLITGELVEIGTICTHDYEDFHKTKMNNDHHNTNTT